MYACCIVALCLMAPRLVLFVFWLFTDYYRAFDTWLWPLLGFLFMPFTTLTYMGAILNRGEVGGFWLILMIIAVISDLGSNGGGAASTRRRRDDVD